MSVPRPIRSLLRRFNALVVRVRPKWLIGLTYAMLLAGLIIRVPLTHPGLVEWTADFRIHYDIGVERAFWQTTWHPYIFDTDNAATLPNSPIYSFFLLLPNSKIAQNAMLFSVFLVTALSAFICLDFILSSRKYSNRVRLLSTLIGATVYTANPWVLGEAVHWFVIWTYALTPILYVVVVRLFEERSLHKGMAKSLILGVLFGVQGHAHGLVFSFLFVLLVAAFYLIWAAESRTRLRQLMKFLAELGLAIVTMVAVSLYWILPYLLYFGPLVSTGPSWILASSGEIYSNSIGHTLLNNLRLYFPWEDGLFVSRLGSLGYLAVATSLLLPIAAFSSLLLKPANKHVLLLSSLAITYAFLGKGTNPPFGDAYAGMALNAPIISNVGWLLRAMYVFIGYAAFALVMLSVITFAEMVTRLLEVIQTAKRQTRQHWKGAWYSTVVVVLVLSVSVNAVPALSGDNLGLMVPAVLPNDYFRTNAYLDSQGFTRVAWLPPTYGESEPLWSPYLGQSVVHRNVLTMLPSWASSRPVLGLGTTTHIPTHARIVPQYLAYEALLENRTRYVGKLYGIANVDGVVFHNDTTPNPTYSLLLQRLRSQKDLTPVFQDGNITVFRNPSAAPYTYAVPGISLVVGGLDTLVELSRVNSYVPYEKPLVFVEQYPSVLQNIGGYIDLVDEVIFFGNKTFADLALASLGSNYLFEPASFLRETRPLTAWDKDFFYSHLWIPVYSHLFPARMAFPGIRYDFALDKKIILTQTPNATFAFPVNLNYSGDSDVWVRVARTPGGGNLSVAVNGVVIGTVDTYSLSPEGFSWVRVADHNITAERTSITLRSISGFNAINMVAITPVGLVSEKGESFERLFSAHRVRIVYVVPQTFLRETPDEVTRYDLRGKDTLSDWYIGNGAGEFQQELPALPDTNRSTIYSGVADRYGNFYLWFDPNGSWNLRNYSVLRVEYSTNATADQALRVRIFLQDSMGNWRMYFSPIPSPPARWNITVDLNNYAKQSSPAFDLARLDALNIGFTGQPNSTYRMSVGRIDALKRHVRIEKAPPPDSRFMVATHRSCENQNECATSMTVTPAGSQPLVPMYNDSDSFQYYGPLADASGNLDFSIQSGEIPVDLVLIFSLLATESRLDLSQILSSGSPFEILRFDQVASWHFQFQPTSGDKAIYVLGEGYHPLWIATQGGQQRIKLPINGILNGFVVTSSQGPTDVEFAAEDSFHAGMGATYATIPLVLTAIAIGYEIPWLTGRLRRLREKLFAGR